MKIRRERQLQSMTKVRRRPSLRRGRVSPRLPIPDHIPQPPYVATWNLPEIASEDQVHDPEGIEKMRAARELAARVLNYAGTLVRPSVTTDEIDKAVHQMIVEEGAYPSPLPLDGGERCKRCHCKYCKDKGYHGDTSKTFICQNVTDEIERLVKGTFGKIWIPSGLVICGAWRNEETGVMVENQTFTIEPILTMGSIECVSWPDNWTTLMADGAPAAQFEHTILITWRGAEILTKC